jgi:thioredoxin reductase
MVALNFNMLGYAYQQGVGYLEEGFATSAAALAEHRAKRNLELQAYEDVVAKHQETSVSGLYAAGDLVRGLNQISVASGEAAIAATAIHNRLPKVFA